MMMTICKSKVENWCAPRHQHAGLRRFLCLRKAHFCRAPSHIGARANTQKRFDDPNGGGVFFPILPFLTHRYDYLFVEVDPEHCFRPCSGGGRSAGPVGRSVSLKRMRRLATLLVEHHHHPMLARARVTLPI